MDTASAKSELKKMLKVFSAVEKLDAVLSTAEAAEQRQGDLDRACVSLSAQKDQLEEELATLKAAGAADAQLIKESTVILQEEHRALLVKSTDSEAAILRAEVDAQAAFESQAEDFAAAFEVLKAEREEVLADLARRTVKASALLSETREKFKELS